MPIYDMRCLNCGHEWETICGINEYPDCPKCTYCNTKRLITQSGHYCGHEAPAWLRKTAEVVDRDAGRAQREFVDNPTRQNYHRFLKAADLRPFDKGEKPDRPKDDYGKIRKEVLDRHFARKAIEVR